METWLISHELVKEGLSVKAAARFIAEDSGGDIIKMGMA